MPSGYPGRELEVLSRGNADPQITVGIGNEVRDSNMELGGMVSRLTPLTVKISHRGGNNAEIQNDAFTSTSNFLNGTFRRMTKMAKRQGGTWCWLLAFVMFVLWLFIMVWWLRR